ncbi:MAG: exopolysaccharide biosynthesis polyprenyl glycosylphosphotransferase [Chitinophagales bacterium]|nr:exopolysaccharide biosynthesis polyprenyl glycosylphosphotransferase [Chitinophagales bacterium]MCZ2392374.1 exopolysaccharide biosynthesis polyprenyl glycosylphosphotransferase [Chitinophagales bacterium]
MIKSSKTGIQSYWISDYISAYIGWIIFFLYRKSQIEQYTIDLKLFIQDKNFLVGGAIISIFWIYLYIITNTYKSVYFKSRIAEIFKTFIQSILGSLILSFFIILDDAVQSYKDYYYLTSVLFLTHFIPTLILRMFWLFLAKREIKKDKISFPSIVIGNHKNINKIVAEIQKLRYIQGIEIKSIYTDLAISNQRPESIQQQLNELKEHIKNTDVSHAILILSKEEREWTPHYIQLLDKLGLKIKIIPELYESLTTQIKINNPIGTSLIDVYTDVMSPWQIIVKRTIDILISLLFLIISSPFLLVISIYIKKSSPGPILYQQERIGKRGRPFTIYKLRSMYLNAEDNGPQLSKSDDERITHIGKWIRKYRIDEFPQFYNVLIGDMSLVGPRPEREYFASQIIKNHPEYEYIYKVKPGITSWGMVRFGYASTLEEMIERMEYDLMYINNFSLLMDLRIMIYTILIIIKGKGV